MTSYSLEYLNQYDLMWLFEATLDESSGMAVLRSSVADLSGDGLNQI